MSSIGKRITVRGIGMVLMLVTGVLSAANGPTILVTGVTGRQGVAVSDELQARGYTVRGTSRKPEGKKAKAVSAKGIEVVYGNYDEPDSLQSAMKGVYGVFFYSGFSRNEKQQGTNVIAAARKEGVKHFLYSSGAAAAPGKGMKGAIKTQIEQELVASGVPYSVIRPVAFMENFDRQQARILKNGVVDSRDENRKVFFIAVKDIGFFAGEVFDNPDDWLGRGEDIAGDGMTLAEMTSTFADVLGQDVGYTRLPLDEYLNTFPPPLRPLFRWYDEVGYDVDVTRIRKEHPQLLTLDQYLRSTGWENWSSDK
jgi:uncharacterized protein YbjT (DUF2867 family)